MRIACVLIHNLPTQVVLTSDPTLRGQPLVIGGLPFEAKPVYDASPEAMVCGIKLGMPLHEAYALCPEAKFLPSDERMCEETFRKVVSILERFSPVVNVEELGGAYIDVTGVRSEQNLVCQISASMSSEIRLSACLGISGGKFFSRVAALTSKPEASVIISQGQEKEFIAPFSIDFLPCSPETKERLNLLGIRFIGQLSQSSQEAWVAQFGSDGIVVHELSLGVDRTPLVPIKKPEIIVEATELDPPAVTYFEILQSCQILLEKLLSRMKAKAKQCSGLLLKIVFDSGAMSERRFPLKEATNSNVVILSRLQAWLESIRFPGPAVGVELSLALSKEGGTSLSLWTEHRNVGRNPGKLACEFKSRFGYQPLKKMQLVNPGAILSERRFRLKDVLEQEMEDG